MSIPPLSANTPVWPPPPTVQPVPRMPIPTVEFGPHRLRVKLLIAFYLLVAAAVVAAFASPLILEFHGGAARPSSEGSVVFLVWLLFFVGVYVYRIVQAVRYHRAPVVFRLDEDTLHCRYATGRSWLTSITLRRSDAAAYRSGNWTSPGGRVIRTRGRTGRPRTVVYVPRWYIDCPKERWETEIEPLLIRWAQH